MLQCHHQTVGYTCVAEKRWPTHLASAHGCAPSGARLR